MTRQDKLYKIAINYGYEAQSRQCIEEMAELTQAINKLWRKRNAHHPSEEDIRKAKEHAIEELADVYIMVWQMIILLGAKNIDKIVDVKLDRQIARIEHE